MSFRNAGVRAGNAMMRQRIMTMSVQPYRDGQPAYRVVAIRGRRSGQIRQVPLAVFQLAGQRYLIAPTRQRDWVENLIAARECEVRAHKTTERYTATLTQDTDAVSALMAYRRYIGNGMASEQFPFPPDAPITEIQSQLENLAIFRLVAQENGTSTQDQ